MRPNLLSPGLVLSDGTLAKPLADYLRTLEDTSSTGLAADIAALDVRVTALAAAPFNINGTPHQITLIGDATTGIAISIAYDYPGQTSITTLGTITVGAWNGTVIGLAYGGTGQDYSTRVANTVWAGPATGADAAPAFRALVDADIPTTLEGRTFTTDVVVPDEAYDATAWNGSLEVPTKNAIRDKIETLSGGSTPTGTGLYGVTSGVMDAAAVTVSAALDLTAGVLGVATGGIGPTELAATAVTPGSYTAADITVDADGRITAAANGAGGGGGGLTLKGSATVSGSAATTATISGLSLSADKLWQIRFRILSGAGSDDYVRMYFNGDTTNTNYDSSAFRQLGTSSGGARFNGGNIIYAYAGKTAAGVITTVLDSANKGSSVVLGRSDETTGISLWVLSHLYRTAGNITSVTFSHTVANGLGVGTTFEVWA